MENTIKVYNIIVPIEANNVQEAWKKLPHEAAKMFKNPNIQPSDYVDFIMELDADTLEEVNILYDGVLEKGEIK